MTPYYSESGITIYHSDMRDELPAFPAGAFDLATCDPPYGIGESNTQNLRRSVRAANTDHGDYEWDKTRWDETHFSALFRASREQIIWGGNYYSEHLKSSPCWLVWDKDNGANDFSDCELAWGSFDSAVRKFRYRWNGMRQENMARKEPRVYPTQKPVALMKWVLTNYVKHDFRILDACCGGGSTLVAAKDLGMKAVGIDISERACEISANRLRQEVLSFEVAS